MIFKRLTRISRAYFCAEQQPAPKVPKTAKPIKRDNFYELFLRNLPKDQAAIPTMVQSRPILQSKLKQIMQEKNSIEKSTQLIECYNLLEENKLLEDEYQNMQNLNFEKSQIIENIMFETYIRSNERKAMLFMHYLEDNNLLQLIFHQHFSSLLYVFIEKQDLSSLNQILQILKRNSVNIGDFDFSGLKSWANNENLIEKCEFISDFLRFNYKQGSNKEREIPGLKELGAFLIHSNFQSQTMVKFQWFESLAITENFNDFNVDYTVLSQYLGQLSNDKNALFFWKILTSVQNNSFYTQYFKNYLFETSCEFSDNQIQIFYQKSLENATNKSLFLQNMISFILDESLSRNLNAISEDIYINIKKFEHNNQIKSVIYENTAQSLLFMNIQEYHEPFQAIIRKAEQEKIHLNPKKITLMNIQCLSKEGKHSQVIDKFYEKLINDTIIQFQKQKLINFLDLLKKHLSVRFDENLVNSYIQRFIEKNNDSFYYQMYLQELSDNKYLQNFLKEDQSLQKQQKEYFYRFTFDQIKKRCNGDLNLMRKWFNEWKDRLPDEEWISYISENFDQFVVHFLSRKKKTNKNFRFRKK